MSVYMTYRRLIVSGWDVFINQFMCATAHVAPRRPGRCGRCRAARDAQPPARGHCRSLQVEPDRHLHQLGGVGGGLQAARGRHRAATPRSRARWRVAPSSCSKRSGCRKSSGNSPTVSGTSRRCDTTRISATTPSTPSVSRSRFSSRAGSRPSPGSTRSC